jgi:hypothetical protein
MMEFILHSPLAKMSYHDAILALIPLIMGIAGLVDVFMLSSTELSFGVGGIVAALLVGYGLFIRPP